MDEHEVEERPQPAERPGDGDRVRRACSDPSVLMETLCHAVIATDLSGFVQYWNRAAERLYGWTAEEAVGRNISELTVPEQSFELAVEIMGSLRAGGSWSGGFTVRRKDGSTFPALVTDSGVYDGTGVLVGVVGVSLDLGQAVRPLLARSTDAAVVLTRDSRMAFISPASTAIFGWTEDQHLGTEFWELVHPDDRGLARDHYGKVTESSGGVAPFECRVRAGAGDWCWAEMVMTSFLDDPAVHGVVCNLRDVTERRSDREQLVKLTEQLQTALTTRVVIEQAKGMLAEQHGIGVDQAFEMLRRHARTHNARLHDVAGAVVNLGLRI